MIKWVITVFVQFSRLKSHTAPVHGISSLDIQQLLNEAEEEMKNFAGREGCYPPRLKLDVYRRLPDLQNSSYPTNA